MRKATLVLFLVSGLKARAESESAIETEEMKSLNEVKTLHVFENFITIVSKNETTPDPEGDVYEGYLRNHLIRIKSPLDYDKYLDFELDLLIPVDETEGRQKKRKGVIKDVLVPVLLMIKHKLSVALPLFLAMVTFVAFKGFWAGMTALVISKVIGLKLLLQSKQHEGKDNNEDHGEDQGNGEQDDDEKPIVVYLHSHTQKRRISNGLYRPAGKRYYGPESWDPWGRQPDVEKANRNGNRLNRERQTWN